MSFSFFRKHQKLMIATLAILAMGAFVFLDPLMGLIGGGGPRGGVANPLVILTNLFEQQRLSAR